jgi:hypothetical protein
LRSSQKLLPVPLSPTFLHQSVRYQCSSGTFSLHDSGAL